MEAEALSDEEHDQELARLIDEQRADDVQNQRPEEHGGNHGDPVLSAEALGLDLGEQVDGVSVSGASLGQSYDEAVGPPLQGRWKQARLAPIWSHVEDGNGEAAQTVRDAIAGCTPEQRETFRLVYAERLSYGEAAERLGIDKSSVRDRVETLKRIVTRALVQAAGGDAEAVA